jgi:hypothetical protein
MVVVGSTCEEGATDIVISMVVGSILVVVVVSEPKDDVRVVVTFTSAKTVVIT